MRLIPQDQRSFSDEKRTRGYRHMSANTTPPTTTSTGSSVTPEKVFVKITQAGPGQKYHAPKNFQQPALRSISTLIVILMALSLPLVPAILIVMIAYNTFGSEPDLLW